MKSAKYKCKNCGQMGIGVEGGKDGKLKAKCPNCGSQSWKEIILRLSNNEYIIMGEVGGKTKRRRHRN